MGGLGKEVAEDDGLEIVSPVPESLYDQAIHHLRFNFFPDEPLNRCVGLCPVRGQPHPLLEEHTLHTLADGLSVVALDTANDNKVVGIAVNGILKPGDMTAAQEKLETTTDVKFKRIFGLLYSVSDSLDLFNKYDVDKIFECRILSVDRGYRGRRLGERLLDHSHKVAKEHDFKVLKGDSTGLYSQKILAKLGYQSVYQLLYKDYLGEDGNPVFDTEEPHTCLKIMIKTMDD
ncbi:hypothetical protein AAG570_009019 [Ranatra chinensis]|uniref:aralkylamine N-acetyltransferase n=1 Tax=Ranatra chinensis TaxID=642074 RepID=A0ABD0Z384_9HEMI